MKTKETILNSHSKQYGNIENNPRAIVLASEAFEAMDEYFLHMLSKEKIIEILSRHWNYDEYNATFNSIVVELQTIPTDKSIEEIIKNVQSHTLFLSERERDIIKLTLKYAPKPKDELELSAKGKQVVEKFKEWSAGVASELGIVGMDERSFTQSELEQLQNEVHKIIGDGEVMKLFNKLLGVSAG